MRVIILEGPDGAGKTTLAKFLHEASGFPIIHTGPPPDGVSAFSQCYDTLVMLESQDMAGVIIDRFHIGEQIYGPLLRGRDSMTDAGRRVIDHRLLDAHDPVVVYCLPPLFTVMRNIQERGGDDLVNTSQLETVYMSYMYGVKSALPARLYDYTQHQLVYRPGPDIDAFNSITLERK